MLNGAAPIAQLRTCERKIVHIQGTSPNVVIVFFPYYKRHLLKETIRSLGEQILSFNTGLHLKTGATNDHNSRFSGLRLMCVTAVPLMICVLTYNNGTQLRLTPTQQRPLR